MPTIAVGIAMGSDEPVMKSRSDFISPGRTRRHKRQTNEIDVAIDIDRFDVFDGFDAFEGFDGFDAFDGLDGFDGLDRFEGFDGFDGFDGFGVDAKSF